MSSDNTHPTKEAKDIHLIQQINPCFLKRAGLLRKVDLVSWPRPGLMDKMGLDSRYGLSSVLSVWVLSNFSHEFEGGSRVYLPNQPTELSALFCLIENWGRIILGEPL